MRGRVIIILFMLALLTVPVTRTAEQPQPRYWIALNFSLRFFKNGTVVVEIKQHPFDSYGRSLLNNKNVTDGIIKSERSTLVYTLLLFSKNPKNMKYKIIKSMTLNRSITILCDPLNNGTVVRYRGAVVMDVLVYLNTTDSVREISKGLYEVKVADSITSMDPRGWIDVMEFIFQENMLTGYSWSPSYAKGATEANSTYLLWVNRNEKDAPDVYILKLKMNVEGPNEKRILQEQKIEVFRRDCEISVRIKNMGPSDFIIVRFVGNRSDQARKVFVDSGGNVTISVMDPSARLVQAYRDGVLVYNKTLCESEEIRRHGTIIAYVTLLAGLVIIIGSLLGMKLEGSSSDRTKLKRS